MKLYMAVGIGGMIGASLRYLLSIIFTSDIIGFPWATLFVNLTGAFVLAYLLFHPFVKLNINSVIFVGLTSGVIGSFTTFSTITIEIVMIWRENMIYSLTYIILSLVGGLLCSFLGYKVARVGEKVD